MKLSNDITIETTSSSTISFDSLPSFLHQQLHWECFFLVFCPCCIRLQFNYIIIDYITRKPIKLHRYLAF